VTGGLLVAGLSLRLGAFALREVDLRVGPREILVLLGPNGAGKSVTLETIAGFHRPLAGHVAIAGRDVTRLPPERRQVSLLPQNYGLFPHLSVVRNVMLPIAAGGPGRRAARREAERLLLRFAIAPLAARLPGNLSPGERQRAALARALAARSRLLLFDEPFAALDAATREALREELRAFLRDAGIPAVFVTHDLAEAMALADRLAVIAGGRILQQGEAAAVYGAPADRRTAALLGVENILPGRLVGHDAAGWRVRVGEVALRAAPDAAEPGEAAGDLLLAVRAEDVALRPADAGFSADGVNRLPATVRGLAAGGALVKVRLDCGFPLVACLTRREAGPLGLDAGRPIAAEIAPAAIRLLAT
jgi:molybdate/tungstate transport system ATP-binding protein